MARTNPWEPSPANQGDGWWPRLRDAQFPELAERVGASAAEVEEYRRFLRLAEMFPGEVCPPPRLAEMWQKHDLSAGARALGIPFDPGVGQGDLPYCAGPYMKTRRAYQTYFDTPPPSDIWPDPVLPTDDGRPPRSGLALAGLLLLVAVLADTTSPAFRGILVLFAAVFIGHALWTRLAERRGLR